MYIFETLPLVLLEVALGRLLVQPCVGCRAFAGHIGLFRGTGLGEFFLVESFHVLREI